MKQSPLAVYKGSPLEPLAPRPNLVLAYGQKETQISPVSFLLSLAFNPLNLYFLDNQNKNNNDRISVAPWEL